MVVLDKNQNIVEFTVTFSINTWSCLSIQPLSLTASPSPRQVIVRPHKDKKTLTLTLPPMDQLKLPISLMCTSLECGRMSQHLGRTHTDTGRARKLQRLHVALQQPH